MSKLGNKLITLGNDLYIVLGTVSTSSGFTSKKIKSMWRLADTVLRNGANHDELFVCQMVQEAEFEDKK